MEIVKEEEELGKKKDDTKVDHLRSQVQNPPGLLPTVRKVRY
jgi:hypothetical protein